MVSVAVVGVQKCASINVAGLFDVIRKADGAWQAAVDPKAEPIFEPFLVGLSRRAVAFRDGASMLPTAAADEITPPDVVVVPGLDDELEHSLEANGRWIPWLAKWFEGGSRLATSCTGAFLAAEAGLLDGRRATTHWAAADEFRRRYPNVELVVDQMIVDTGDVITSGGATTFLKPHRPRWHVHREPGQLAAGAASAAGAYTLRACLPVRRWFGRAARREAARAGNSEAAVSDLVIYLTERFGGHGRAVAAAKVMLVDGDRRSQLPYIAYGSSRGHNADTVHAAQELIEAHLDESLRIDGVAAHAGVSVRTLARRFKAATGLTPSEFQAEARMMAARRLLETTRMTVTEIRTAVGYNDGAAFGRAFKRAAGLTPTSYRRRYESD